MIELRNISRIYKSKSGSTTNALKDVSLEFGVEGMTFILGKSGSGKSTLLNILGGLDQYDGGDFLVLGKSTKNFETADFDSYRNTYVGFVFQEFNLLEDYNVYENIMLALQLQQKEVNLKEIEQLLEKLELTELKYRKVNELSGGQKQRVAIARALIKKPKIILADEPTGNLDSETSRQVMNLLKEISKERLVIVVSHDRESAYQYGDRIIEIKDGKIVSDAGKMIEKKESEYQVIPSKLPWKESFKLGIGSLRYKKIKLFFTIVLTIFSLLFIGIVDTLNSYDINLAHAKLLEDKEEQFVQVESYRFYTDDLDDYTNKDNLPLMQEEIEDIQKRISKKSSLIYRIAWKGGTHYADFYELFHMPDEEYIHSYNYGTLQLEIVENIDYLDKVKLIGRKPSSKKEIVISNVIADDIIKIGVEIEDGSLYKPKNYQELIDSNHWYLFGDGEKVKIVGIIDYDLSKYKNVLEKYRDSKIFTNEEQALFQEYSAKLNNIYNKIYVLEGFSSNLKFRNTLPLDRKYYFQIKSDEVELMQEGLYIAPSLIHDEIEYFDGKKWVKKSDLKENEVVVPLELLSDFDYSDYREKVTIYINQNLGKSQLEAEKDFFQEYIKKYDVLGKKVFLEMNSNSYYNKSSMKERYDDLVIVGVTGLMTLGEDYFYVSSETFGQYDSKMIEPTGVFILENKKSEFQKLMKEFPYYEEISLKSSYSFDVTSMVRMVIILKRIALLLFVILTVFAIILMSSFMISSISYRKKEIGILRGLGARNSDIIKIFIWEGFFLATISFIITSILLLIITSLLNIVIMSGINILLTPFIVTIRQFVVIFMIAFIVIAISSIFPIRKITKMKPIDAILNK